MAGELRALLEAVEVLSHVMMCDHTGITDDDSCTCEAGPLHNLAAAVREALEREIDGAVMLELFAANTDLQGFARAVERRVKAELMGGGE